MKDFPICTLPGLLSASKRTEYRNKCREQAKYLLQFIAENKLNASVLPSEVTDDLVIMASDLTQEGLAVMREGLHKWVAAQDRAGSVVDTKILDAALLKVRSIPH